MTSTISNPKQVTNSNFDLQRAVTHKIRVAMAETGKLAQKDLAKALQMTPSAVSAKFTGKTLWNLEDIEKAARYFNVSPAYLVSDISKG